jgi:hypothetical protein
MHSSMHPTCMCAQVGAARCDSILDKQPRVCMPELDSNEKRSFLRMQNVATTQEDCIPPHIDHHDFSRPFCTISLLSEQPILFGQRLFPQGPGQFGGSHIAVPLPPGASDAAPDIMSSTLLWSVLLALRMPLCLPPGTVYCWLVGGGLWACKAGPCMKHGLCTDTHVGEKQDEASPCILQ